MLLGNKPTRIDNYAFEPLQTRFGADVNLVEHKVAAREPWSVTTFQTARFVRTAPNHTVRSPTLFSDFPHIPTPLDGYTRYPVYKDSILPTDRNTLRAHNEVGFVYMPDGIDAYLKTVIDFVKSMGIRLAKFSLIKKPDGDIARGSTRIPIKVETERGTFVVKAYDNYNPTLERDVLTRVSGKIAPRVIYFGETLYAEEVARGQRLLDFVFGKDNHGPEMQNMVDACARIFAELARLGVHYHHNHCVDEFRVTPDQKFVITDFGTSHFFYDESWYTQEGLAVTNALFAKAIDERDAISYDHEREKYLEKVRETTGYYRQLYIKRILCSYAEKFLDGKAADFFGVSGDEVIALNSLDIGTLVNLMFVAEDMEQALKNFFEKHQWGVFRSGWDILKPHREGLRQKFIHYYLGL